ncbi:SAM-dependent methyltransferase [bacterium]|nr:SAM-dependent methyltransferase [bacterium]
MPTPVSQSGLWKIQQDYYQKLGVAAWEDRTPFHLTNSQVFTDAYAELILAYWQDHPPDPKRVFYLLELGSGIGRFACQLVRDLTRKLAYFERLKELPFCLVLSDIVPDNLEFWRQHPKLQELGPRVDFCVMEPGREDILFLEKSGTRLDTGGQALLVLANYVFDSMPHDEFRVTPKGLEECLIELQPELGEIEQVEVRRSYAEVSDRYPPHLEGVLDHYARNVREGAFTVPVGALDCLKRLRGLAPLAVLASDRGFTVPDRMTVYPIHPHTIHQGGCFSHMVNFHALSLGFRTALMTRREVLDGVQTVFLGDFDCGPQLRYTFEECFARANALNNCSETYAPYRNKVQLRSLLGFLRLNLCDPNGLAAVARQIPAYLQNYSYGERLELLQILEETWANDYFFRGAPNVTFWLAHIYDSLRIFDRALWFYEETARRQGRDAMLLVFQAQCLQNMRQLSQARQRYLQALDLVPGMAEASQGLNSLDK